MTRDRPAANVAEVEAELLERDALYANARVGLCFIDPELRYVRVNERLAAINGRPAKEHIGATIQQMIPGIADQVAPLLKGIIRTGEPVTDHELRATMPFDPGVEHTWLVNYHPVAAADGTLVGILGLIEDVTESRRARDKIRILKEHLAEAQRVAGIGSWEWNIDDDVMSWTDELFRVVGKDPGIFRPTFNDWIDLIHPDDRPAIREQIEATLRHDEAYAVEFRVELDTGEVRTIEAHAVLERCEDGRPRRLVGTARHVRRPDRRRRRPGGVAREPAT